MSEHLLAILSPADRLYTALSLVGVTADTAIYSAISVAGGRRHALRVLLPRDVNTARFQRDKEHFLRERVILDSIRHPNLALVYPKFEATLDGVPTVGYGTDWPSGSLADHLVHYPSGLPVEEGRRLLSETLSGLQALHGARIAVRHLCPESLLMDDHGTLLLARLSPARTSDYAMTLVVEGASYAAPEVLDGSVRDGMDADEPPPEKYFPGDIFSVGLVFYEAFVGRSRWKMLPTFGAMHQPGGEGSAERMSVWLQDREKALPKLGPIRPDLPRSVTDLIDAMVCKDPTRRPASTTVAIEILSATSEQAEPHPAMVTESPDFIQASTGSRPSAGESQQEGRGPSRLNPIAAPGGLLPAGFVLARRYQILEEVGRGGMGVVYKAKDQAEDRMVAVKVLFPHCADADSVKRFQREAQAAARLRSPHIVMSTDIGQEFGLHFLVMEYVEGEDVQRTIKKNGKFSQQETTRIAVEILGALKVAHDAGIIHRDVKSPNVILDAKGTAKLTDFGIARVLEGTRLTSTAATLGTPEYMSPEQCQGTSELDAASDIYSLGIVLFEMLTGQLPFIAQNPSGVWLKHIQDPPPDPRQLAPDVSKQMCAIVLTALVKRPERRFASAQDMIDALEGKRRVVMPGRGSLQRSIVKLNALQKVVVASVAGLLLLAATIGLIVAKQRSTAAHIAEDQRHLAEEQRVAAQRDAEEKDRQKRQAETEARAADERRQVAEQNERNAREQAQEAREARERTAAGALLAQQRAAEEAQQRADNEARERAREREAADRRAELDRRAADQQIAAAQAESDRRQRELEQERARRQQAEDRAREEKKEREARVEAARRAEETAAEDRERARRQAEASRPRVSIDNVSVQHNIPMGYARGMAIFVEMTANNLRSVPLNVAAFFSFPNGQALVDADGVYSCGGQVCAFTDVSPLYDGTTWSGGGALRLMIPYPELDMARGRWDLLLVVEVRTNGGSSNIARSAPVPFQFSSF